MRNIPAVLLASALVLSPALPASSEIRSPDLGLLQEQNRIKEDSERKIQKDILDPMLGPGKAMVFVDVEMEVKLQREEKTKSGLGLAERYREKLSGQKSQGAQTTYVLPGIPQPKTISQGQDKQPERPESVRALQSQQMQGLEEERFSVEPVFKKMLVTVIHDDAVLSTKQQVEPVRKLIVEAMGHYKLTPDQVVFRAAAFKKTIIDWRDDLKRPDVYIPLLFAALLFLLLSFLFGPLARFFRNYVAAIREKPGAEVNVESKMEAPDEEGGGGGGGLDEEGKLDITWQNKAPEPPPEENDAMKKFEPFAYINEENLKRLVYMFLLRKEEPWVVAVVISYLRPDYARQIMTSLPVDLQAKVALEALTVRQVTRDQVEAIDKDVKENVDFVVGGMERLLAMLDEVDSATRSNILNYLKNEKPGVYEKVRKYVLTFDDIANFPDREMQVIVRELKAEAMGRALQNASPEVVNKFLTNMSANAATYLKEAMEYTRGLSPTQIDEDRGKIMDMIKVMEKEGKIVVRQKPEEGVDLDGMQEELSAAQRRSSRFDASRGKEKAAPAPAGDPAEAQKYLAHAASMHDAGQFEESIPYFQYAITQDPSLWQAYQYLGNAHYQLGRTADALAHYEKMLSLNPDPQLQQWVESLKTQVGG